MIKLNFINNLKNSLSKESLGNNKKLISRVLLLVFSVLVLGGAAYLVKEKKDLFVVATIDNRPIFRYQLTGKLVQNFGASVLEDLISQNLAEAELDKQKVAVTEDELAAKLDEIKQSVGGDLEAALASSNMTMKDLESQVVLQLRMEKYFADDVKVTDEEVAQLLEDYADQIDGTEDEKKKQAVDYLRNQKLQGKIYEWLEGLKQQADIRKFI